MRKLGASVTSSTCRAAERLSFPLGAGETVVYGDHRGSARSPLAKSSGSSPTYFNTNTENATHGKSQAHRCSTRRRRTQRVRRDNPTPRSDDRLRWLLRRPGASGSPQQHPPDGKPGLASQIDRRPRRRASDSGLLAGESHSRGRRWRRRIARRRGPRLSHPTRPTGAGPRPGPCSAPSCPPAPGHFASR